VKKPVAGKVVVPRQEVVPGRTEPKDHWRLEVVQVVATIARIRRHHKP